MKDKMNKSIIDITDISKYRQTLMGIAIFSVMFSHWFGFQGIESGGAYKLSDLIVRLVFTQGLLFLSGFGLYYSFSKDNNVISFYKRRLLRLYVPFVILSIGLYAFFLNSRNDYNVYDLIAQITSIYFWYGGNYGGMWYVSVSIALYIVFPLLYKIAIRKEKEHTCICALLICVTLFVIPFVQKLYNEEYFKVIKIGILQIPYFVIGMFWGFLTKNEFLSRKEYIGLLSFIFFSFLVFTILNSIYPGVYWIMECTTLCQKLFFMPFICIIFNILEILKVDGWLKKIFNWFGYYSLELYILHLHTYMFLSYCDMLQVLSPAAKATIAMITAIVFCVPINRFLAICTKLISK